jgi:thiol-disulfide isomerase/thioredoxin
VTRRAAWLAVLALLLLGACSEEVVTPAGEARPAPELERKGLDGAVVSLKQFRGQVVLLNFWATWCPFCQEEIPHLIEMQAEYGDQGLQVVGAALNWQFDSQEPGDPKVFREKVGAFSMENGLNYPLPLVAQDMKVTLERFDNPIGTIPYSVLIDREGRIRKTFQGNPGPEALRRAITRLL